MIFFNDNTILRDRIVSMRHINVMKRERKI